MQNNDYHNTKTVTKYVAGRIVELRNERGWSQLAMSESCGMHPNQIGKMERGESNAKIETIYFIVHAFNVTWEEFFKDFDGKKSS